MRKPRLCVEITIKPKIIEKHIAEEHHLSSTMSILMREIARFQSEISNINIALKSPDELVKKPQRLLRFIENARSALRIIHVTNKTLTKEIEFEE